MLGGTGRRLPNFGDGGNFGGSGELNKDTYKVTASQTKIWPLGALRGDARAILDGAGFRTGPVIP